MSCVRAGGRAYPIRACDAFAPIWGSGNLKDSCQGRIPVPRAAVRRQFGDACAHYCVKPDTFAPIWDSGNLRDSCQGRIPVPRAAVRRHINLGTHAHIALNPTPTTNCTGIPLTDPSFTFIALTINMNLIDGPSSTFVGSPRRDSLERRWLLTIPDPSRESTLP